MKFSTGGIVVDLFFVGKKVMQRGLTSQTVVIKIRACIYSEKEGINISPSPDTDV
jgi:hypothetical protein